MPVSIDAMRRNALSALPSVMTGLGDASARVGRVWRALVLALSLACNSVVAQLPVAAPAASAAAAPVPSQAMAVVGEWQGPFAGTKVVKLLDAEDGVACYFYVPASVPTNTVCNGGDRDACQLQYPSGVGSLSCVKVRDGNRPPAKPASRR